MCVTRAFGGANTQIYVLPDWPVFASHIGALTVAAEAESSELVS